MMRKAITTMVVLAAGPAAAHSLGGAHYHPHPDPVLLVVALAVLTGLAILAMSARR